MNMPIGYANNTAIWYELSPAERAELCGITETDYINYLHDMELRYTIIDAALTQSTQELENA